VSQENNLPKKVIKTVVESPAKVVDASLNLSKRMADTKSVKVAHKYFSNLGPGMVTGAADDDPSGIATYSQTGAKFGYQYLWLALFSLPFMALVQEMCARIGLVTGRGLAGILRSHYPKWILYFCTLLLFVANTINIGADIGAMASSANLLVPSLNFSALAVIFTLITLGLQIFIPYHQYAKYLKILALALFAYVIAFFFVDHGWSQIARATLVPSISFGKDTLFLLVAVLGTTISPYLFFWEASQEVEKQIDEGRATIESRAAETTAKDIKKMRRDVYSGMSLSNIIMFFIIGLAASTLHRHGITDIETTRDAAEALRPLAGDLTYYLFAIGVIGTGLLAIPVLAGSASYAISEMMGWQGGSLNKKLDKAYAFYGVIIIAVILGLALNYLGVDPIKALIYAALLNGLVAPILIVFIVLVSNNAQIMGRWKNSFWRNILAWLIVVLMGGVGLVVLVGILKPDWLN
jgi:NRAMP (natural resistance-associated macrophage protein)-like metal ion transporter